MNAYYCLRVSILFVLVTIVSAQTSADTKRKNEINDVRRLGLYSDCTEPAACTADQLRQEFMIVVERGSKDDVLRVIAKLKKLGFLDNIDGYSPLAWTIGRGRSEVVTMLLQKGADPLAVDRNGRLVLYSAIATAYSSSPELPSKVVKCVRLVLENALHTGRMPPTPPLDASIVFYGGARKPNLELLKLFIKYGAEPNRKGWYFYEGSPLDAAINKNSLEAVRVMIAPGSHITQRELDEKAFGALTKQKTELLRIFHSAGANPKRYIDANPKILFDAARPGGSVETLEFLLKNKANPNAVEREGSKRTLIFATGFDPEKMALLFKYGADPNTKDEYTILANVLFHYGTEISIPSATSGQASRRYDKVSLVKFLLDHGANPNIDNGGWGQWGALGLTRREDKEVIELLIKRGATLHHEAGKSAMFPQIKQKYGEVTAHHALGSITIATAFLERDDLALALLARDGRVNPADKLALLEATRRGWDELAVALIHAGTDPNVADASGVTPLAMAERRKDKSLIKALLAAGAKPSEQTVKLTFTIDAGGEFETAVAKEIDDVIFLDPPRFAFGRSEETSFALYGEGINKYEEVKCERSVKFSIIANMGIAGGIGVGVCRKEAIRMHDLAGHAQQEIELLFEALAKDGAKIDKPKAAELGWLYVKKSYSDGSLVHYFPVIAVGHGILSAPTVLLISKQKDQAIIVQANVTNLCGEGRSMQNQTPLCSDTQAALIDIARRLYVRFDEK